MSPPINDEHWSISERGVKYVTFDPTTRIREDIVSHCPSCALADIRATRWIDNERLLVVARVHREIGGRAYILEYGVMAKTGRILLSPRPWPL